MGRPLVIFTAFLAMSAAAVRADEVRLRDGRVLVGKVDVANNGTYTIHTWEGPVQVQSEDVLRVRSDAMLRKEFARVKRTHGDSPFAKVQLAQTAFGFGLEREMWRTLDEAVEAVGSPFDGKTPDAPHLARYLSDLLRDIKPVVLPPPLRQADSTARAHHLLSSLRSDSGPGLRAALLTQLVAMDGIDAPLWDFAHEGRLEHQRHLALEAVAHRDAPAHRRNLIRSTVLGAKKVDREMAALLVRKTGRGSDASLYVASGLFHDAPHVRMQTAAALAELGAVEIAVPLLVRAGPLAGTPTASTAKATGGDIGTRGHMSALNIKSYIRDFDVEIASGTSVANPNVQGLKSGVVLDAKVAAVVEAQARIARSYRRALHGLTGSDPGGDPRQWLEWLRNRDPRAATRAATGAIAPLPTASASTAK